MRPPGVAGITGTDMEEEDAEVDAVPEGGGLSGFSKSNKAKSSGMRSNLS